MTVYSSRTAYLNDRHRIRDSMERMGFSEGDTTRILLSGTRGYSCEIVYDGRVIAEPKITACICPGVWD